MMDRESGILLRDGATTAEGTYRVKRGGTYLVTWRFSAAVVATFTVR